MEIRFGVDENGAVSYTFGSRMKPPRANKGKSLLIKTNDFISIDIETTGLSPEYDEIIELGAAKYRNGVLVDTFSSLVKPESPIDEFITQMTGITNEMLENSPNINDVLPAYIEFLGQDILIGHNVNFDINFIYDACESMGLPPFSNDFIDTMRIARRMYKSWSNHKLDTLIAFFNLGPRALHRGLGDCELTAACYQKMAGDSERFNEAMKSTKNNRCRERHSLAEIVAVEGQENPDNPLFGKVCVFTGALESFTRKEAAQLVVNIGGICADNITKKTNFLILGNNDYCKSIKDGKSNKQKKAEQLIADGADLAIVPETVFLDLLQMACEDAQETAQEQIDTTSATTLDFEEAERQAFLAIAAPLKKMLENENLSPDYLYFKMGKSSNAQYSSVYLFNESCLFCRISFRGGQGYFSIPAKCEAFIPEGTEYKKQAADPNYIRIALNDPQAITNYLEILRKLLDIQLDAQPTDFGCCARYEQCSNEKRCVNPDSNLALRCAYRKNIRKGRIFYGKNRNI